MSRLNQQRYYSKKSAFVLLLSIFFQTLLFSHGYVDYPKARQQFCVDDGGYWWPDDGSAIPNNACRAAFLESGTFQFVQNIEFSANVADYNNHDAVKAVVTDGTLCASADHAKRGINLPSSEWQKTNLQINADNQFELLFYGATPHNPSFWEFYLTKPNIPHQSEPLKWSDLELIDTAGNVPITKVDGKNMYRIMVQLPANRTGDAILLTRWQREDTGGEGFYNCSDISFESSTSNWFDKGYFIKNGTEAKVGDELWFRVFNSQGNELVFEKLTITESNASPSVWAKQLATQANQHHSVSIGKQQADDSITYDESDIFGNKVWVTQSSYTFALDIKTAPDNQPPSIQLGSSFQVNAGQSITISANASDPENDPLTYQWSIPADLSSADQQKASISIQSNQPTATTVYALTLTVSDGEHSVSATTQLTVKVGSSNCQATDPNAGNYPAWKNGTVYHQGTEVSHNQLVWKANWWTNSAEPKQASEVWTLLSDVQLGWSAGKAYAAGEEVDHNNRRWKANWWTQSEPGNSTAWKDIGEANCQK